ncbi:Rossmann-like and DUF2520 domain-containing protein [Thermosyntropha sp.]|uniref:Rossmann-like and DUF2520 domain-containing protein n=1 Tax=Thermosyntropha sp. TaxID=2740820 RepID=UPI0025D963A3|nr:Rossmann-like and DUF2520 domain-containing protein [Thermosyntropha sp.]MBO8159750.1 DUF2520 domain-containing protein [Thermosyntropha sp.]
MRKTIGIIGAGVVGTAVGVVLSEKGYEVTGVYDIKPEATWQLAERTGCITLTSPEEVSRLSDVLFITTSDSAIKGVVDRLADSRAFYEEQIVLHMSGAQSSEILDRAKVFGSRVLSVHPIQSFASPDRAIEILPGSVFSIEGDKDAYDVAVDIVEAMHGEYFFISREAKPLYHAGACVVSNYLVTLVDFGVKLLETTGIPKNMAVKALMPLINGTVNNIEKIGIPKALTGPIARGDVSTVLRHLSCMEEALPSELMKLYSLLGMFTAHIALEKGSIDEEILEEFRHLFKKELMRAVSTS